MSWLHTWGGLWFTWLLITVFVTGSLGVFEDALSHWMREKGKPGQPLSLSAQERLHAVELSQAYLSREAPEAKFWTIGLPGADEPDLRVFWRRSAAEPIQRRRLDPISGAELGQTTSRETEGGHHFVHMHFELQAGEIGVWVVGGATMALLVALISGIAVHRRIFADFFTFRPGKGQRSWLDGHNALGVLTLPFLFMIAYTGLVVFWATYMPAGIIARYDGNADRLFADLTESPAPRPRQNVAAPVLPLPPLMQRGEAALSREAGFVVVNQPGDRNAVVRIMGRFDPDADADSLVGRGSGTALFDGVNGETIDIQEPNAVRGGKVLAVQRTLDALHFVHFGGYTMKWLYFLSGMTGASMLATGAILFMVKRRKKAAGEFGTATPGVYRVIEALNLAAIGGLLLACIGYLWINRLLPLDVADRPVREVQLFFAVWLTTLLHAAWRAPRQAWIEQIGVTALLCLTLPLLNVVTTGDWFIHALARGDAETAGVELTAMGLGLLALASLRYVISQRGP